MAEAMCNPAMVISRVIGRELEMKVNGKVTVIADIVTWIIQINDHAPLNLQTVKRFGFLACKRKSVSPRINLHAEVRAAPPVVRRKFLLLRRIMPPCAS